MPQFRRPKVSEGYPLDREERRTAGRIAERRHVVPNTAGGWDVKSAGSSRASSHHATLAEATAKAREIVKNLGAGEVIVHRQDGRLRDANTLGGE
jgi:hypothetical protein